MEQLEFGPSVKGSVFLIAVQGVKWLLKEGGLSQEEIECELEASDQRYLEEKILLGGWYPVGAFERFSRMTLTRLGREESEFFVDQGKDAARRLLGSEVYAQFAEEAEKRGGRASRSMLTMARLIFNFARWELRDDGNEDTTDFEVAVSEAEAMPEVLRYAVQGFIQHVASLIVGFPTEIVSERPSPDFILFRGCRAKA
jgi:hypothetical protein